MKKNKIVSYFLLAVIAVSSFSCQKNFLDKPPLSTFSDAAVWQDVNLVQAYVNARYQSLPNFDLLPRSFILSTSCNEGFSKFAWSGNTDFTQGRMSTDVPTFITTQIWGNETANSAWMFIRNCNLFFSKIKDVPAASAQDQALKKRLTGEVRFLRAFSYFELVERFGGVPLVTQVYELGESEYKVKRNTFAECVDFITKQADSAATELPGKYTGVDIGRITSVAALALKARMLLYAASPLFNGGAVAGATPEQIPLVSYPTYDKERWNTAITAIRAAIKLAEDNGGALNQSPDYKRVVLDENSPEIILNYSLSPVKGTNIETWLDPNSYNGWSAFAPTQNLVDLYEMQNGKLIDEQGSGYDENNPYVGRDKRFEANILHNMSVFRGTPVEIFAGGKDSDKGPQGWNATLTGYNWRKWTDETIDQSKVRSTQNYMIFRVGELYLNLAEALAEYGQDGEARIYLNKIRSRASVKLPDVTVSGNALIQRIRHERLIELCMEGHWYFDVRRWKIAEQTENVNARGVRVTKTGANTFTYAYYDVEVRKFLPQHYFMPITRAELNRNEQLVQNPLYSK